MRNKQIVVVTWNDKLAVLPKGKTLLQPLIGSHYLARIGYLSLLNLDYCLFFYRPAGYKGYGGRTIYSLLKMPYASNVVQQPKAINMKCGILRVLPRKMALKVLLRQIPRESATNIALHRYNYQFVAACLMTLNGEIIDIDSRCRDAQ